MQRIPALRLSAVGALVTATALVMAAVLATCSSSGAPPASGTTASTSGGALRVGGLDPLPERSAPAGSVRDFAVTGWDDKETTLGSFGDGPMVINFWASWCVPCVTEMPDFETVHRQVADQVTFVGVNVIDRLADGQRLVDQTGVSYALARDPGGALLAAFGGTQMPTTVFVAADGTVREVRSGPLDAEELHAAIRANLL